MADADKKHGELTGNLRSCLDELRKCGNILEESKKLSKRRELETADEAKAQLDHIIEYVLSKCENTQATLVY